VAKSIHGAGFQPLSILVASFLGRSPISANLRNRVAPNEFVQAFSGRRWAQEKVAPHQVQKKSEAGPERGLKKIAPGERSEPGGRILDNTGTAKGAKGFIWKWLAFAPAGLFNLHSISQGFAGAHP
jgi:hypothetical protein